jgi:hypothetical protein
VHVKLKHVTDVQPMLMLKNAEKHSSNLATKNV